MVRVITDKSLVFDVIRKIRFAFNRKKENALRSPFFVRCKKKFIII